ncbi:transcription initiation factor IIE subunit beta-like [Lytechinus variegatus]|uniref:transcription initiation factor IIE subunit beta-like n=1 Tax=Lytechinus variegatus TaxID=7654 RepID=UPI001BB12777|nr:transcription initiation factor IIE subunit beta-like [Lytechinus variegatus]
MDQALLREREAFLKRAKSQPVVEKKRPKTGFSTEPPPKKKKPGPGFSEPGSSRVSTGLNYKTHAGSSKYKFGILAKIVNFMKTRYQEGDFYPLNIDEILDETKQQDVGQKQKMWLVNEALPNNPKVTFEDGKYSFKPAYNVRNRKEMVRLLKRHDQRGLGGIMMDDVMESLPHAKIGIKKLEKAGEIIILTRPDKKQVVYYNDRTYKLKIEEEFKELWNSTTVDSLDEEKIQDYLKKQGINSMKDHGPKKFNAPQRKKPNRKGQRKFKTHNDHISDVLKDYSDAKK